MAKKNVKQQKAARKTSGSKEFASESSYLKGADVKKPFDAKVTKVEKKTFDDGPRWVLHLDGHKPTTVNKTNGMALVADLGEWIEDWVGCWVTVSTEQRRNPRTNSMVRAIKLSGAEPPDEDELDDEEDLEDELPGDEDDEDLE